jgi:hypothetical protein
MRPECQKDIFKLRFSVLGRFEQPDMAFFISNGDETIGFVMSVKAFCISRIHKLTVAACSTKWYTTSGAFNTSTEMCITWTAMKSCSMISPIYIKDISQRHPSTSGTLTIVWIIETLAFTSFARAEAEL